MGKIYFLFGIHNHQPVGNFEHVFSEAYDKCYSPLLETLAKFPKVRFSIHHSGPLIEWIETNKPEYMKKLKKLVDEGQTEIMSGGFYEPILSIIPESDASGQLEMMNQWAEKKFAKKPRGAWLAERIWDPALPRILSDAGMEYTLLDDTHFNYAGLSEDDMHGYYVTERHGSATALFPIDKFLRDSLPFRQPEETLHYFRELIKKFGTTCVTYGDDGEKFGLWPETYDWVYNKKWLERFLKMLSDNRDVVKTITYSEYIDRFPARGRIYLPMASYEEMMHWTLPKDSAVTHTSILEELKNEDRMERYKPFLRGAMWDNFLVKYEESNNLHKRMLYASKRVKEATAKTKSIKKREEMLRELYKGQCNCPYWHGLFGGLYLSNLRHEVYRGLINSGKSADEILHNKKEWIEINETDFHKDNIKKTVTETKDLFVLIDPSYGGSVAEIDYKPASFNITNIITRTEEEYHQKIRDAGADESSRDESKILSPHDRVAMKDGDLGYKLVFDKYIRRSFFNYFTESMPSVETFRQASAVEAGLAPDQPYKVTQVSKKGDNGILELSHDGHLNLNGQPMPVWVKKLFKVNAKKPEIVCEMNVKNNGDTPISFYLGMEWNFTLLAADALDRHITINSEQYKMNSTGEHAGIKSWKMTDEYFRFSVGFSLKEPATLLHYPIETVSQSEGGFEANYQGTCFIAVTKMEIAPGKTGKAVYRLNIKSV